MILHYWDKGWFADLDVELLKYTLPVESRMNLEWIHPGFMDPEDPLHYLPAEVEVARIDLASVMSDFTSIRARLDPEGIRYRVVDEYETEFRVWQETSRRPLTLKEMIHLIDGTYNPSSDSFLAIGYNEWNSQSSTRAESRHFTDVSSDFYPQLRKHFDLMFADWVADAKKEEEP